MGSSFHNNSGRAAKAEGDPLCADCRARLLAGVKRRMRVDRGAADRTTIILIGVSIGVVLAVLLGVGLWGRRPEKSPPVRRAPAAQEPEARKEGETVARAAARPDARLRPEERAGEEAASTPATPVEKAPAPTRGWVNNIKVVSDKVEDVTTLEAILDWMVKPGMSDREKALAVWETVVKFRHQDSPPNEWTENEGNVRDPVKTFNVYGYGMCGCAASNICALARAVGLRARGKGISGHSVPEVFWDGDWHLLDASLINYFPDEAGDIASIDEIAKSVREWYDKNPGYEGNDANLRQFMRNEGWKKGPKVLAGSQFYSRNGWLPAATHGWYSTMAEYAGKRNFVYEYGYSMGYRALFRLRPGEVLTRNWFNKGLHVNMGGGGGAPGCLGWSADDRMRQYQRPYGDIAPGRVGNGTLLYRVPLPGSDWRSGAWQLENVARGRGIAPASRTKPAEAVFRMHCPYVFLGGKARLGGKASGRGSLKMLLSTNNALDWKEVWRLDKTGSFREEVDLGRKVLRRYDYYVKLVLEGDVRLDALELENDIQHSQRALPALAQGTNTITVSAGEPTDTVTIAPVVPTANVGKNEDLSAFRPALEGVKRTGAIWCKQYGVAGLVTFPVETPGDIRAVRFGGHFRARDKKDGVELLLSFDGGGNWIEAGRAWGPYAATCKYVEFGKAPPGVRKVLVRYRLTQKGTVTGIFGLRIDVDYWNTPDGKPPRRKTFRPLKLTYVWKEGGAEKRHVQVVRKARESYEISSAAAPLMRSLVVELAE